MSEASTAIPTEKQMLRAVLRNQAALARALSLLCDQQPRSPRLHDIDVDLQKVTRRCESLAPAAQEQWTA